MGLPLLFAGRRAKHSLSGHKLIEKRLADFKKNPEKGILWEAVEKELYELLENEPR